MNNTAKYILAISMLSIIGCEPASQYSGDGQLVDKGSFAATDRYVLNLGSVDLTQQTTKTFRLSNLPEENFVVGIEVDDHTHNRAVIDKQQLNANVMLELTNAKGKVIFTKKAPLNTWTWSVPVVGSQAFVYGRGNPDTYFDATLNTEYMLTISVLDVESSKTKYSARLLLKSGGWK
jgi:hypothetical protein